MLRHHVPPGGTDRCFLSYLQVSQMLLVSRSSSLQLIVSPEIISLTVHPFLQQKVSFSRPKMLLLLSETGTSTHSFKRIRIPCTCQIDGHGSGRTHISLSSTSPDSRLFCCLAAVLHPGKQPWLLHSSSQQSLEEVQMTVMRCRSAQTESAQFLQRERLWSEHRVQNSLGVLPASSPTGLVPPMRAHVQTTVHESVLTSDLKRAKGGDLQLYFEAVDHAPSLMLS